MREVIQSSEKPIVRRQDFNLFRRKEDTELIMDASPIGLGAILTQIDRNGKSAVVAYASRALTPTEQRYSQIDREMLDGAKEKNPVGHVEIAEPTRI